MACQFVAAVCERFMTAAITNAENEQEIVNGVAKESSGI
jgi:hypothetical protein